MAYLRAKKSAAWNESSDEVIKNINESSDEVIKNIKV
jgi:hypothetical protein